jgi:NAD(P)-dependent dehydrogenase (short-subunit alcohol dehydrogenase family)
LNSFGIRDDAIAIDCHGEWVSMGKGPSTQDLFDRFAAATPLGRLAESRVITGAAYFLASDDSSYCTGSELVVDSGWTAQ